MWTGIALLVVLALLAALAVLQLLVASGLPCGRLVWGGTHRVLPRGLRVGSAVSVLVYAGLAALLLSRAISRSPAERWTMTPASLLLAAATLVIALG